MRISLLALLFQFIAPAFFYIHAADNTHNGDVCLHKHHRSIAVQQLLKEKNETEIEAEAFDTADFTPLLDFAVHALALIQWHEHQFVPSAYKNGIHHHPPLFTLHHALII